MELSLFDVVGPVMIGPSSSHTAGAARLAYVARLIAGEFKHVTFGLHGSFAKTYKGHGTDRALVAGALGLSEQDERLRTSFEIPQTVRTLDGFIALDLDGLRDFVADYGLAMDEDDIAFCQQHFRDEEKRDPTSPRSV